ncbi:MULTISPECIES: hypothetical protein [Paenibacillus]|uniref:Uncharacterized protein n=1 Tax=Paenibacillus pabuli TaxID=1472 RepID=A0A855Y042_9BACL|nr:MULTISPECIES: hypothetical protein [Paenibacillus]PWW42340.1 hypothetical protein DET56_104399 [Paenibacillus pabuli]PXW07728.1 hypothetical protein DEU73_105398 [Paenibacillus taichungensis]RAI94510.1 hypothetical protein DET54_10745 [Paenibacillus pabuli]
MNKKKLSAAILAIAMLTLTSVASAAEVVKGNPDQQPSVSTTVSGATQEYVDIRTKVIDEAIFYPMDAILISNVTHTGSTAYKGEFTTAKGNGDQLNVWVNNKASTPVYVTISRDGTDIHSSYKLDGGAQKTFNFIQYVPEGGITGNWKVYVYNSDGSKYNLNINARQF